MIDAWLEKDRASKPRVLSQPSDVQGAGVEGEGLPLASSFSEHTGHTGIPQSIGGGIYSHHQLEQEKEEEWEGRGEREGEEKRGSDDKDGNICPGIQCGEGIKHNHRRSVGWILFISISR